MAMRVTQGVTNRSYLKNLNTSQYNMNQSMEKLETGRKFSRVSDDVRAATKTIDIRSKVYRNDQIQINVNTGLEELQMSESLVSEIKDITSEVTAEMFKALNEPTLEAGKEAYVAFLEQSKLEVLRLANKQYNNKYLLGGLGVEKEPFTIGKDGELKYNDVPMKEITNHMDREACEDCREYLSESDHQDYRRADEDEVKTLRKSVSDRYDNLIKAADSEILSKENRITANEKAIEQNDQTIILNDSKIESNEDEIAYLESQLPGIRGPISYKENLISEKQKLIDGNKSSMEENRAEFKENCTTIENNINDINTFNELNRKADDLNADPDADVSEIDDLISEIKDKLGETGSDVKPLSDWIDKLSEKISSLETDNDRLNTRNDDLNDKYTKLITDNEEYRKTNNELRSEISSLKKSEEDHLNSIASLNRENTNLEYRNKELELDSENRSDQNVTFSERIDELKSNIDQYEIDKEDELEKFDSYKDYYINPYGGYIGRTDEHVHNDTNDSQEKYYRLNGDFIKNSHDNYIDVGTGILKNSSVNSKFNISADGVAVLGYGFSYVKDEEDANSQTLQVSNNIYDMMQEMQDAVKEEDTDKLRLILNNFKKQSENIVSSVSEIGVRERFLETSLSRLENESSNLAETKNYLEATDDASEITKFKGYQNSWNLILQFGGNVVPKSLMDYIR